MKIVSEPGVDNGVLDAEVETCKFLYFMGKFRSRAAAPSCFETSALDRHAGLKLAT